ncbi:MAG: PD-(D/E)XK nuclease family protein [Gemmatimonadota bacterium]
MESATLTPPVRSRTGAPHLSYSRIQRYLHCPEQYRLYYVKGLRPRSPSASLAFGQIVHQALAHLFQERGDPVQRFRESWEGAREAALTYAQRDSWEKMAEAGERLLEKFVTEELPKLGRVESAEKEFRLDITSLEAPLIGFMDLVAEVEGVRTVVDFKTSGSKYGEHEAAMSDQLTAYQLAEPEVEQSALCVLVRTKTPKIEWHITTRSPEQIQEYLAKADVVASEIHDGRFFKRPGMWCSFCDYLPVCTGNAQKAEETLVQIF